MKFGESVRTHIPAAPGWNVVTPVYRSASKGSGIESIHRSPVIAWYVETNGLQPVHNWDRVGSDAMPITACTDETVGSEWALESPRGDFIVDGDGCYDSIEALIEEWEGIEKRRRAAAAVTK